MKTVSKFFGTIVMLAVAIQPFHPGAVDASEDKLAAVINKLVSSYNNQDAQAYYDLFGPLLREEHSQEDISDVLRSSMSDHGSVVSHQSEISSNGSKALLILSMEEATYDVHLRINDEGKLERLTWSPHKSGRSDETRLSAEEASKYMKRYSLVAEEYIQAIKAKDAERLMSLFAEDDDDEPWTLEDYSEFLEGMNARRGEIKDVGEIEISKAGEFILPVFYENMALGFYIDLDRSDKISGLRVTNYAATEDHSEAIAKLGNDTLKTIVLSDFAQLEDQFRKDEGKIRFITLLSPT